MWSVVPSSASHWDRPEAGSTANQWPVSFSDLAVGPLWREEMQKLESFVNIIHLQYGDVHTVLHKCRDAGRRYSTSPPMRVIQMRYTTLFLGISHLLVESGEHFLPGHLLE